MAVIETSKPLRLLLVEDAEEDIFIFEHALRRSQLNVRMKAVRMVYDAIDYLQGKPPYADAVENPFPDVVVTDLKIPQVDGFELLEWMQQSSVGVIPTIVMSSSCLDSDVARAYRLGANAYMVKPQELGDLTDYLIAAHAFWTKCKRPRGGRGEC